MKIETFETHEAAAQAAAEAIAERLSPPGERRLLVTGGSGPGTVYDRLARRDLDWSRVTVALSDERFVDPSDERSNERLVRQRLLQGRAAAARLAPLKGAGPRPEDDARAAEPSIRALSPFDAALLGMGPEGHIASLYAANPDVGFLLDPDGLSWVAGVRSAGWKPFVPRITLTGRALFACGLIVLLVSGEEKRALIEEALADPGFAPPVAALIRQTRSPVRILWSPEDA